MHNKLIKTFVKDYENIKDNTVRNNYGSFTAILGIISNVVLFTIKLLLGIFFGSISILADGLNNLVDSISSIVTLIGFKLAAKPADKQHPFGHARYESISGLLVGVIVVFVGLEFTITSIKEILNPTSVNVTPLVFSLLIISILIKLWQYLFNNFVGKKIESNVILATAIDSRNDVFITLLVLVGVVIEFLFKLKIDGYVGLLLAIIIIISGINAMRNTVNELLGQRPSNEDIAAMEDLISSYDNILGYHDLVVHQYGHNQYFATVHVEVDAKKSLVEAHNVIDKIEDDFLKKLNIDMVIHLDPVILDDPIINAYFKQVHSIIKSYDQMYSLHDFRLVKHYDHNVILFDLVVGQEENKLNQIILKDITQLIKKVYPNDNVDIIIDRNYISVRGL